jgi:hypothetical protein
MRNILADPFVRNVFKYIGTMLVGALAAGLSVLVAQLASTDPISWRPVLAAALGPIVTGLLARQLTKGGREHIGNLVTQVGVRQARAALETAAARQTTTNPLPPIDPNMTPEERDRLLTLIREVGAHRSVSVLLDEKHRRDLA